MTFLPKKSHFWRAAIFVVIAAHVWYNAGPEHKKIVV